MKRVSLYALIVSMLFVFSAACSSSKSAEKDDKKTSKQMAQKSEDDSSEKEGDDEEKEGEKGEKDEEHPGDEHPGEEHEGDEHPGDEHPGDSADKGKTFGAKAIKTAMRNHIEAKTAEGKPKVFEIKDRKTGETLELKFVKIHDPVRKMPEKGYFACTDFHVAGSKKKLYDLDFWLSPKDGKLKVTKTKIHKHPEKKDGEWVKKARYTFKNDEIAEVQ